MNNKSIVIDGKNVPFEDGQTIMQAATAAGFPADQARQHRFGQA